MNQPETSILVNAQIRAHRNSLSGNSIWNKVFDGGNGDDYIYDMAIQGDDLYVVGITKATDGYNDWWIKKFDLNGSEDTNWNMTFSGTAVADDYATRVVIADQ